MKAYLLGEKKKTEGKDNQPSINFPKIGDIQ